MKRTAMWIVSVLLCLLMLVGAAQAGSEVNYVKGQKVTVFDQNGVHLYFTGEVEDTGFVMLQMKTVLENNSDQPVTVVFEGVCNGWSFNNQVLGGSMPVRSKAKAKSYVWLDYEDMELKRFSDIEDLVLDFIVKNSETNKEIFRVTDVTVNVKGGSAAAATVKPSAATVKPSAATAKPAAATVKPAATAAPAVSLEYYEECPILPTLDCYGDVYQSGSGRSSTNGKVSKIYYRYRTRNTENLTLKQAMLNYVVAIKQEGFTVTMSGSDATIFSGSTRLATLSNTSNDLTMNLLPGNEKLTKKPSASASSAAANNLTANGDKKISLGDTIKPKNCTLKLESAGTASKIYSYGKKTITSYHRYMEPNNASNTFVYVYGTFTNTGSTPVDIRRIYSVLTIDGKYSYEASATAVIDGGSTFYNDVSPMETVGVYFYAEVPKSIAKTSNATLRLGFTDDFSIRFLSNNLPDFNRCTSTYELPLEKKASTSSSGGLLSGKNTSGSTAKPTVKPTVKPGSSSSSSSGKPGTSLSLSKKTEKTEPAIQPGSVITYGNYEQDNDTKNGKEPLEWVVLDVDGDKALIITTKVVDYVENTMSKHFAWNNCKVRSYLNDTFLSKAFTSAEQKAILTTQLHTDENPYYLRGACDTKDKVFCLSMNEIFKYFKVDNKIGDPYLSISDPNLIVPCTEMARMKAVKRGDITAFDKTLSYWMRDAAEEYAMMEVDIASGYNFGSLSMYGCWWSGVRPAMWVDITKLPK